VLVTSNTHEYFEPTLALLLQLVVLEGSYTHAYIATVHPIMALLQKQMKSCDRGPQIQKTAGVVVWRKM